MLENTIDQMQYKMKTELGSLYFIASSIRLEGVSVQKQLSQSIPVLSKSSAQEKFISDAVYHIEEYLLGKRKKFDFKIKGRGTSFQQQVWQALSQVPFGLTVSYLDIAKKIKKPKAVRAVANAIGKNPFLIMIPCHRVIHSSGALGGYVGGLTMKQKLLDLEQGRR